MPTFYFMEGHETLTFYAPVGTALQPPLLCPFTIRLAAAATHYRLPCFDISTRNFYRSVQILISKGRCSMKLKNLLLIGAAVLCIAQPLSFANDQIPQLPSGMNYVDLLNYLDDYIEAVVFPPGPPIDNSHESFDAMYSYSYGCILRFNSVIEMINSRFSEGNALLLPLVQGLTSGYTGKNHLLLNNVWRKINWERHYATDYAQSVVAALRQNKVDLLAQLRQYLEKYGNVQSETDREIAIEAIRADPSLVARGLERELIDLETRLQEARKAADDAKSLIDGEIASARTSADVEIEQIRGQIREQQQALETLREEAAGHARTAVEAQAHVARIEEAYSQVAEKIGRLSASIQDLFTANTFGERVLSTNFSHVHWPSYVDKRMENFSKAIEAAIEEKLADLSSTAFGANHQSPNLKIFIQLQDPAKHRNWIGFTNGFSGTLEFRVNLSMGQRARDSFDAQIPVTFSSGKLSSNSVKQIAELISENVMGRMTQLHATYTATETASAAAQECLALLTTIQRDLRAMTETAALTPDLGKLDAAPALGPDNPSLTAGDGGAY